MYIPVDCFFFLSFFVYCHFLSISNILLIALLPVHYPPYHLNVKTGLNEKI